MTMFYLCAVIVSQFGVSEIHACVGIKYYVYVIEPLRVQYGINLHECVLKKSKLHEPVRANAI